MLFLLQSEHFLLVTLWLVSGHAAFLSECPAADVQVSSFQTVCCMSKPGYDRKDMRSKPAMPIWLYVGNDPLC